jgi:hypothetical protein
MEKFISPYVPIVLHQHIKKNNNKSNKRKLNGLGREEEGIKINK